MPAERRVDLAADAAEVDLDDVGVAVEVDVPGVGQELGLRHGRAGVAHQVLEDGELLARQVDVVATARGTCGRPGRAEVVDLDRRPVGRRTAAQQGPQPGQQHDERERLGEVVVGAGVERLGDVVLAVLGRQHQDRRPDAAARAGGGTRRSRCRPRQHDVEHDDVVGVLVAEPQGVFAVVGDVDGEALLAQGAGQPGGQPHLVVDDEDPHQPVRTRNRVTLRRRMIASSSSPRRRSKRATAASQATPPAARPTTTCSRGGHGR